jgi:N-hydroxyarylamine O-acetyltransferase
LAPLVREPRRLLRRSFASHFRSSPLAARRLAKDAGARARRIAARGRRPPARSTPMIDLDAYFARIGWGGSTRANLETLAALLRAHMRAIPFENLDVLLGRPIRLDPDGLQRKLVQARRGGYCFEHATLFAAVLEALGFQPVRHSARVVLRVPRTASPRTHMFLTLALPEGRYAFDPGFGSLEPVEPVPLDAAARAPGGSASHSFARDGPYWTLRAHTGEGVVDCWVSTLEADHPVDFEVANHYVSTHAASAFVNNVMLRALTRDGRVSVFNRDVTIRDGGTVRTLQLEDRAALRALLAGRFGIDLAEVETLRVPAVAGWS